MNFVMQEGKTAILVGRGDVMDFTESNQYGATEDKEGGKHR